ncbi:glycine cleavage system aminomethyltransferase GcvT [Laspinema olomoucense]|uniref:Aminomethyltransferase n=1 Tax=Laspinema olomoucense D3b TaxID=2953688 RepID=A0ABT2NEY3_9CYAN|nr:glycine cleavage system aminomethyltransferase GcvT [Laspinema sp. D3b]MCT7981046.1 glycine cleavage system aminomethyltransferase GcvT [Laspinema sp. D3b]
MATTAANETAQPLSRTPLYEEAIALNARMTAFSGWEMPVQFSGINPEHQAVRTAAGMFDISHMGMFSVSGKDLLTQMQGLVPSDLSRLQPGEGQYTVLLNDKGGILDDIIFYDQGQDETGRHFAQVIVNAATCAQDKAWLLAQLAGSDVEFQDLSKQKVLLAVQGPEAVQKLQQFVEVDLSAVKPFGHLQGSVCGGNGFLARTGYTGEDGYEVMVNPETGMTLWRSLLNSGVTPCGLGCRDTLRLEAAMALYGQDIDQSTTPLEAGLGWLVHLDTKGEFIGREVLVKQKETGVKRRLVGIEMQGRYIARHGYPVISEGKPVGEVTSGSWSPTLEKAIALAYLPLELSKPGQSIEVEIRGKTYPGTVVKKPFYRSGKKPQKA